jgi:hypothetical protein
MIEQNTVTVKKGYKSMSARVQKTGPNFFRMPKAHAVNCELKLMSCL